MSSKQQQKGVTATEIPYSQTYWERLSSLVHSVNVLKSDGYKLEPLDSEALRRMRRCRNCHCEPSRLFCLFLFSTRHNTTTASYLLHYHMASI